jgi:UrcA family protein
MAALLGVPASSGIAGEAAKRAMQETRIGPRGVVTRSIAVPYGDLDLSVQAGAEQLYSRLRGAARSVCGPREARVMELRRAWARCVDKALDDAVAATRSERVVAIHRVQSGRDVELAEQVAGIR